MRIEEAIVEWAKGRPSWQRALLRRAARGEQLGTSDFATITDRLLEDGWAVDEQLAVEDIPRTAESAAPVVLLTLGNVDHVNALVRDQSLEFSPTGLTVVYGDNGSGKSGYARLIKRLVRARHREPVLSDVFKDSASAQQGAEVALEIGGGARTIRWPDETCPELAQITFYDEACGDAFITKESDVTYKPAALGVLDELIRACDGVRAEIERRLRLNDKEKETLPALAQGTTAAKITSGLASVTEEAIEQACRLPDDVDAQIDALRREELRLRAADPAEERERLRTDAEAFRTLSTHLESCRAALGADSVSALSALREQKVAREEAAALASSQNFDGEALGGVGTSAWRAMWQAARNFSREHAYPTEQFPNTASGARCVLCQQPLSDEASARVDRFEAFVRNETQRLLLQATTEWNAGTRKLSDFHVATADVAAALERLGKEHSTTVADCRRALEAFAARKAAVTDACTGAGPWPTLPEPGVPAGLGEQADNLDAQADEMNEAEFATKLRTTTRALAELEARKQLCEHRDAVMKEMVRLRARARLEGFKKQTATTAISSKATELTRAHTTKIMRDRFTRELASLRLERVTLEDRGGEKGAVLHRPALLGAIQDAHVQQVLSEGEQTALGLAGFFTDAHLDASRSAIVLDDPVSSLDHGHREYVATRLSQFAKDRQVVVFTHDAAFVVDLRAAAAREGVGFSERGIERLGSGQPGACRAKHPWKAKDVAQRLEALAQKLAAIRSATSDWDQETYERECSDWAGGLSETWERAIGQEVVGQVIDRASLEVRPRMFRVLARITDADDNEFQTSYARVSRWARRHDKSAELNYVAPRPEAMEAELALVRAWHKRVKGYQEKGS